jgi:glycosyltransferase involved in cell wall biosynthesis
MKTILLIPSVLKSPAVEATVEGKYPKMDYRALAEALEQEKGTDAVILLDYGAVETASNPLVKTARQLLGRDAALALMGFLQARSGDVLFTNGENVGIPLALLLGLLPRRPGHVTIGHRLSTGKKRLFFKWFKVHQRMDTIFLYARTQREFAVKELHIEPRRLKQIAFQADTSFFRPDSSKAVENAVGGTLISAAGLEWRDYPTLINAVKDMVGLTVKLAAASPWSKHSNETERVALPDHVTARRYPYDELRDLYAASQLVAVPLYENDFQAGVTTLLEAMAMGKPVIITQTTGQTDVVTHGVNGITVPPGDVAAWKAAIQKLREDDDLRQRIGASARQWVEENASLTLWVQNMMQALRDAGQHRATETEGTATTPGNIRIGRAQ